MDTPKRITVSLHTETHARAKMLCDELAKTQVHQPKITDILDRPVSCLAELRRRSAWAAPRDFSAALSGAPGGLSARRGGRKRHIERIPVPIWRIRWLRSARVFLRHLADS